MEEYLFRGRDPATKEWVYGDLMHINGRAVIHIDCGVPETIVEPETVGQYIGLKDHDGVKIFEGDILRNRLGSYVVTYKANGANFVGEVVNALIQDSWPILSETSMHVLTVIGNIHDNKELLEAKR